jgi:hypothetical protein
LSPSGPPGEGYGGILDPYRNAAKVIEASGLDYTTLPGCNPFEQLMPAFDLAVRLRVERRGSDVIILSSAPSTRLLDER